MFYDVVYLSFRLVNQIITDIEVNEMLTLVFSNDLINEFSRFGNLEFREHQVLDVLVLRIKGLSCSFLHLTEGGWDVEP